MSDSSSLRNKIIRLAYNRPKLRKHLLPLVVDKTAQKKKQAVNYRSLGQQIRELDGYEFAEGNHLEINYILSEEPREISPVGKFVGPPKQGMSNPTFFYMRPGTDHEGLDEVLSVLDEHDVPYTETPHWNDPIWNPYGDMRERLNQIETGPAAAYGALQSWPDMGQIGFADESDGYPIVLDLTNVDGIKIKDHEGSTIVNTDFVLTDAHYDQVASRINKASTAFNDLRPQASDRLDWDPEDNLENFFDGQFGDLVERGPVGDMLRFMRFESRDNSTIKMHGRFTGDILARHTESQTVEERNEAQRILDNQILPAMSDAIPESLNEFIVSAEIRLGDKNHFYAEIEYETWSEGSIQLFKDLLQRAF